MRKILLLMNKKLKLIKKMNLIKIEHFFKFYVLIVKIELENIIFHQTIKNFNND